MASELAQLHYITGDELRLLQSYRLISQQNRVVILFLVESLTKPQANPRIENGGNVVPIRPVPTA